MFIVPKQHLKVLKPRQKEHVEKIGSIRTQARTHGRQGESWVPKAPRENNSNKERSEEALGKTRGTSKERKERGETLSSPSQMLETPKEAR